MQRGKGDAWVAGEELPQIREPLGRAGRRPGQGRHRQRVADPGDVLVVVGEVVPTRAPRPPRPAPGEGAVQLGLVAELEPLDLGRADAVDERLRLGRRHARAARLQVDTEDQLRAERRGQAVQHRDVIRGQRVVDAGRLTHPDHWPPGPVGAVATDAQDRQLSGVEIPDQLEEDRIHRRRIGAGVGGHRGVLKREADEPAGNGLMPDRTADPQDDVSGRRPHRPARPLRPGRLVCLRRCLRLSRGLRLGATRAPREQPGNQNHGGQDRCHQSERGAPSPSSPLHQRMLAPLGDGCRVGSVM